MCCDICLGDGWQALFWISSVGLIQSEENRIVEEEVERRGRSGENESECGKKLVEI